jgi:hypothetical protein
MSAPDVTLSSFPQAAEFLRAVKPLLLAFNSGSFTFVSILHEGQQVILRARLSLSTNEDTPRRGLLRTQHLQAAQVEVPVVPGAIETCLLATVAGNWLPPIDDHLVKLLPRTQPPQTGGYSMYYESAVRSYMRADRQNERLIVSGASQFQLLSPIMWEVENELRDLGISSVSELMRLFALSGSDETTLEFAVGPVATIDPGSALDGRHVHLGFSLANGLAPDRFRCVLRNADPNLIGPLATYGGESISWTAGQFTRQGRWQFEMPQAAVVDCQVLYAGQIQGEVRLRDPLATPNPCRLLAELVDPGLSRLEELLVRPKRTEGEDFEAGIAWLLQMLGFAPIHVSAMSGMTDEPDLLAMAPGGTILIIECTTKVPDDKKLTMLVSRTVRMRHALGQCLGGEAGEIMTLLISSLPAEEVVTIREKAVDHSVIVLTREDIVDAVARTNFGPDAIGALRHWKSSGLMRILTTGHVGEI